MKQMPKTQIYFGFFLVGFISALVIVASIM